MMLPLRKTAVRAFTLIELIISVAIFSIVMVIVAAAYLNLINLDRQARATDDVANNLSFTIDSIARAIRTGSGYECDQSASSPNGWPCSASILSFTDSSGTKVDTYILNTNTHQIGECSATAPAPVCTTSTATYFSDPRIDVTNLSFYVRGAATGDDIQPQVIFTVTGKIATDPLHPPVTFTIQTSATQRTIDL